MKQAKPASEAELMQPENDLRANSKGKKMRRILKNDPDNKISLLLDYTDRPGAIADPWYTGDFDATYRDVLEGCQGPLEQLNP